MMFPGWEYVSPRLGLFVAQLGSKSSIVSLRLVRNELTAHSSRGYGLSSSIRNLLPITFKKVTFNVLNSRVGQLPMPEVENFYGGVRASFKRRNVNYRH